MLCQGFSNATLAQRYRENGLLLQQEPSLRERNRVVAAALLSLFEKQPQCREAIDWFDYDMSGTFRRYLENWHTRVPQKPRPAVRRIAREFGIETRQPLGAAQSAPAQHSC
jgi:hypothetical protein